MESGSKAPAPRASIRLALFVGLLWAGVNGSRADEMDTVVLPPWVVVARVDAHTVPARDDSFASTLGATSVVIDRGWSGRSISTLGEALRRAPGVILQESFGGFEPPRISIRGSGLDSAPTARGVALLADGLPLARADGSFQSGLFDPQLFSRIEVYRGTVHAGLTPAVLGGVLNAVSVPEGDTLRIEAGDFSALRALFTADAGAGPTTARVAGSAAWQKGFRANSDQQRLALAGRVQRTLTSATTMELSFYLAREGYEVPGPLTLADAMAQPRTVSAAVRRDLPRRDSSLAHVALQVQSTFTDGALAAGVALQRLHDDFRQLQPNGESDGTSDDLSGHVTLTKKLTLAGVEHHLLARGTFSLGLNTVERFLNTNGTRGARFSDLDLRAATNAMSLEDIVWLRPDLALGGGVTALWARRDIDDNLAANPAASLTARRLGVGDVSPRGGLLWLLRPDLSLYAAGSRGAEPPGFDDLLAVQSAYPNLSLRSRALNAQRATTFEAGVRGAAGRLSWNVAVYRGWWRDEILRLADASGLPRGAVNAARTTHQGVEAALRWRLLEDGRSRLVLSTTASWNDFHFDADPVYGNNRIAGAPPQTGNAELLYERPRRWFAAVESTWTAGATPVDHANRLTYGGSTLWNARAGWYVNPRLTLYVAARNLFDRRYIASTAGVLDIARAPATTSIFLPGAGRGFTVGLEWKP